MKNDSRNKIMSFCVLLATAGVAGCAESDECRQARLAASDVWKAVMEGASKLKSSGAPGFEELSTQEKGDHFKAFAEMEKQADMLYKSFAFEKITWDTADPAKKTLNDAFEAYPKKDEYKSFALQIAGANEKHEAVRAACK